MGELQWALLIVCVVLVVALYVLSRRNGGVLGDEESKHSLFQNRDAGGNQMDLLSPATSDTAYDEFGVGRKRSRSGGSQRTEEQPLPPRQADDGSVREPPEPSMATLLHPLPGQSPVSRRRQTAPEQASAGDDPANEVKTVEDNKMIALIVAPSEEKDIQGPELHAALKAQGLNFGEGQVYHRTIGGRIVYSVSSLLKPGTLIPDEAERFTTKGLTVVLSLPGPVTPGIALEDMLEATRAVAEALKCDIYDARRERLTEEVCTELRQEVEDWARASS